MRNLNAEQQQAVQHTGGPCLVLAGPGTGKTTVIVEHVKELIGRGVPSGKILVLTFTRAAAREMEERFMRDVSEGTCGGRPVFGTFHSLCLSVLKEEMGVTPEHIADEDTRVKVLRYTLKELGLPDITGGYLSVISTFKANPGKTFDDEEEDCYTRRIYETYCRNLRKAGKIDYDDIIRDTERLFCGTASSWKEAKACPERVLRKWQGRFEHILLDEAQDLNAGQLNVAYMLAGSRDNLFMVGDDDQSIYGFRGVSPKNLSEFKRLFPETRVIRLSVNYRSVPGVSKAAMKLIGHNTERFKKRVENSRSGEQAVRFETYPDENAEAEDIARRVRKLSDSGVDVNDIAVLCRAAMRMKPIVSALSELHIPFVCEEAGPAHLTAWVISDLDSYMGLAKDAQNGFWDRGRLIRVMNKPKRGLVPVGLVNKKVDAAAWIKGCRWDEELGEKAEKLWNDTRSLGNMSAEAALSYIWYGCGYGKYVREECERSGVPYALAEMAAREWVRGRQSGGAVTLTADAEYGVRVMTMHASKGLEFRHVFLPTLDEDVMPCHGTESTEDMEEERRLMYVAVTRAKDGVWLSRTDTVIGRKMEASRFLKEMGLRQL